MPIRAYACQAGHRWEVFERMNDGPKEFCLQEGCSERCKRVILAPSRAKVVGGTPIHHHRAPRR